MPSILRSRAPIVLSLCGSCVLRCRMLSCLPARHLAHRQKARSMCRDAVVSMYPRYLRHTLCAGAAIETPVLGGWSKANHMLLFRAVSRQAPAVSLAPAFIVRCQACRWMSCKRKEGRCMAGAPTANFPTSASQTL